MVYVLDKRMKPLMPCSLKRARQLLDRGRAARLNQGGGRSQSQRRMGRLAREKKSGKRSPGKAVREKKSGKSSPGNETRPANPAMVARTAATEAKRIELPGKIRSRWGRNSGTACPPRCAAYDLRTPRKSAAREERRVRMIYL